MLLFPFLLGGTFIEAFGDGRVQIGAVISLPFGRDFH